MNSVTPENEVNISDSVIPAQAGIKDKSERA
jgi:hypothetical protein